MGPKCRSILLITIVAVSLILIYYTTHREDFTTKRTKAQAIYDWFQNNSSPTYTSYKRALDGTSNIVEYEDALALFQNRNLTVESVEKVL